MSALRYALLGGLVLVVGTNASAEEKAKIDKNKLVGTWTFVKTDPKNFTTEGLDLLHPAFLKTPSRTQARRIGI